MKLKRDEHRIKTTQKEETQLKRLLLIGKRPAHKMADTEEDTKLHFNKGNLSDPTEVKKQSVIIIPNQGPLVSEDEDVRTPRPEKKAEDTERDDGKTDPNSKDRLNENCQNLNEISEEGSKIETGRDSNELQEYDDQNKKGEKPLTQVPQNSARSETSVDPGHGDAEKSNRFHSAPEQNVEPSHNDPKYNSTTFSDMDHTLTQSVILDEEEEKELEGVMNHRADSHIKDKGHDQVEGQGCAMCEMCQAEARQNMVTIKVDYNVVFRNGSSGHGGRDGQNKPQEGDVNGTMLCGKPCTPTSEYTEISEMRVGQPGEGKDTIFQQALSLMSERCVSRPGSKGSLIRVVNNRESVIGRLRDSTPVGHKTNPYGIGQPEYFYMNQSKPTPMEPLKVWKGYSGNVYFQPITIQPTKAVAASPPKSPDIGKCTPELQQILLRSRRSSPSLQNASMVSGMTSSHYRIRSGDSRRTISRNGNNQSPSALSTKSTQSKGRNRQSVLFDKKTILTRSNENIEEDILWLAGQESTGSLCVLDSQSSVSGKQRMQQQHQQTQPQQDQQGTHTSLNRDRIRKGSMVRNMSAKQSKRTKPMLSVSGDKFTQTQKPSALIRAQTQYSQSSQRALSDGSYHSFSQSYEKLPPLEQLRASLKQLDRSPSKESLVQVISTEDRIRLEDSQDYKRQPLLKYSPELKFRGVPRPLYIVNKQ